MTSFWIIRIARALLVLLVVALLTSQLALLLPGDPALVLLGQESTEEQRAQLRASLGLDKDPFTRFITWLGGIFVGDWGSSFVTGRPVLGEILGRVPPTVELVVLSQLLALAIIIPLALHSAYNAGGRVDRFISTGTFITLAIPAFVVGIVLSYIFAVTLGWLPASGYTPFTDDPVDNLVRMILPVLTLAIAEAAVYLRTLRGAAIESLRTPYAYATLLRGASTSQLLWRRILRPSSTTLAALVGVNVALALGGTLLVEQLFAVPGLGRLTVSALGDRDLPMIQGVVFFAAAIVVVASILTDLIVSALDPRSSRGRS